MQNTLSQYVEDFYGDGSGPNRGMPRNMLARIKAQMEAELQGQRGGGEYGTSAPANSLLDNLPRLYGNQPYSGPAPDNTMVNNRTGASYNFTPQPAPYGGMALDYSNPIDVMGRKGFRLKNDPTVVAFEDGSRAQLGVDQAATMKARNDAQDRALNIAKAQAEIQGKNLTNTKLQQEIDAAKNPEKPLNEGQANATGYGMRAASAHEIINGIGDNGNVQPGMLKRAGESLPIIGDSLGTLLNVTQSPQQQQIEQAQRDFVNAVLRRESGASISPSEFDNARKQYFPQPGDSPEIVAQKRRNRELSIEALSVGAGTGAPKIRNARERSRVIVEAQIAISKGADPEQVRARLRQLGINDAGV